MKKKGSIYDGLTFFIILFAFAMTCIIAYKVLDEVNTDIQADPEIATEGKLMIDSYHTNFNVWFDNAFLFIFVGLWIGAIISSYLIDTNPAFFILNIILMVVLLVVAGYLSNGYSEMIADDEFSTLSANFPISNFVLENIIMFLMAIFASIVIALFAKERL